MLLVVAEFLERDGGRLEHVLVAVLVHHLVEQLEQRVDVEAFSPGLFVYAARGP